MCAKGRRSMTLDARDLEANLRRAEAGARRSAERHPRSGERHGRRQGAISIWRKPPSSAWKNWRPRNPSPTRSSTKPRRGSRRRRRPTRWCAPGARRSTPKWRRWSRRSAPPSIMRGLRQAGRAVLRRRHCQNGGAGQPGHAGRAAAHHRARRRVPPGSVGGRIAAGARCAWDRRWRSSLEAPDRKLNARVSEIVPSVDAASRTYIVKIDLPAIAAAALRHVRPRPLPAGRAKGGGRPAGALVERGQLQSVFVVEDGVAHTRLVTTGRRTGDAVEVLSGLSAGEKVVLPVPAGLAGRRPRGGPAVSEPAPPRSRGALRARVDLLQADAAVHLRGAAHRRVRGVEAAARGRAADHRADDRRVRADARRLGARGGRARHQADGEAAVGDPGRRVHLLHLQPRACRWPSCASMWGRTRRRASSG